MLIVFLSSRHIVLELYRPLFDNPTEPNSAIDSPSNFNFGEPKIEDKGSPAQLEKQTPPHRYLFYCYVYQYHLIFLAGDVVEMVCTICLSVGIGPN
jgi:hypothetical protein